MKQKSDVRHNKKFTKWNCSTDIYVYSHVLKKEVLEEWNEKIGKGLLGPILFHFIDEHRMKLHFYLPDKFSLKDLDTRTKMMGISLMVSLNIVEPGGHIWWPPALWSVRFNIEENWEKIQLNIPFKPFEDRRYKNDLLDEKSLRRFAIIWPVLSRLESWHFYHYAKAMNLLSSPSPEVKFYEEIFINFWKCIERFIAVEIKKKRKNIKLADVLEAFKDLGKPASEWLDELKRLYILRGKTVAHSFGKDEIVLFEDVGKCKVFADYLMYKILVDRAKKGMKELKKKDISKPSIKSSMIPA